MRKINFARLLVGGVVAGVIGDLLGYVVDGVMLSQLWSDDMLALGHNEFSTGQIIAFNVFGVVLGVASILIYVLMRKFTGANWKTAVYAGALTWVIGCLLPNASLMLVAGLFSKHLTLYTTLGGLVEIVAGTVAGAFFYKDA